MPWPAHSTAPRGEPPPLMHQPIGQAFEEVIEGICSVLISIGYSIEKGVESNVQPHSRRGRRLGGGAFPGSNLGMAGCH